MDETPGAAFPSADDCWQALLARDRGADGQFVYGVSTTGIFCRPSCPSRRPLRRHVRFFADADTAAAAGFRPCRRCRPEGPAPSAHAAAVVTACRTIETAEEPPRLDALAEAAGLSPWHFHRVFKALTGLTPRAYGMAVRNTRLRTTLRTQATVTAAFHAAGFGSSGRFYEQAPALLAMSPQAWRRGGEGLHIRHAVAASRLGPVLVAGTERGICAVRFGATAADLTAELQRDFPAATLVPAGADFTAWVDAVLAQIDDPARPADLPFDIAGTAFQHRVWQALQKIAPGQTASYRDIAAAIGQPGAVRAVARACAANPVALLVPCHRVIRADGALSGYRWGAERKRALLEAERQLRPEQGDGAG
jgi:AraC family transcriptional regulator of adaptative response/methylated-DNA-[protein]-cysteine methyltransferase